MKTNLTSKAADYIDISSSFPTDAAIYSDYIVQVTATVWSLIENCVSSSETYRDDYGKAVFNLLWNSQAGITSKPNPDLVFFNVNLPGNAHEIYLLKATKAVNSEGKRTVTISTMSER